MAKGWRLSAVGILAAVVIGGVVVGVVALDASNTSAAQQVASARQVPLADSDYRGVCPIDAPVPRRYYDLGSAFAGFNRSSKETICNPAPPADVTVLNGPSEAVGYVSVTYGSCAASPGAGCFLPLEVQSWPQCARNSNTFKELAPKGKNLVAGVNPAQKVRISNAPWMPAQAFEGGRRLEIYSGATTIVVFARTPQLAHQAASALAAAAEPAVPNAATELRMAFHQPGDASTCTHRLTKAPVKQPTTGER